ncbi:MAG TPA: segregation/condensation protein A [Clostridiales bacterium]|nr:segregation/condensation protein A [Clostridiales bacterium]
MAYTIKLDIFEGPLDLLLHLISKAKMDIKDISISDITQQYLDYLGEMKKFDIEIASEFLVMASTLVYIKSCNLVPRKKHSTDEDNVEDDEIDSREKLVQKLIEYKQYKEVGEKLRKREIIYSNVYYKQPEDISLDGIEDNLLYGLTKYDLFKALEKVLSLKEDNHHSDETKEHVVRQDTLTLQERSYQIKCLLNRRSRLSFFALFEEHYSKTDVIVTFLALLNMIKENQVELYQEKPFDDIIITKKRG